MPRKTFGMLRDRGFGPAVFCDPCKDANFINLVERPDLADVPVGSVDFQCRARTSVVVVRPWYRRKGFDVVRATTPLDAISVARAESPP